VFVLGWAALLLIMLSVKAGLREWRLVSRVLLAAAFYLSGAELVIALLKRPFADLMTLLA
jgi:hypothetical protein